MRLIIIVCIGWKIFVFLYVDLQARANCDALTGQVTAGPKVPTQF
jgi:hypothetical protein